MRMYVDLSSSDEKENVQQNGKRARSDVEDVDDIEAVPCKMRRSDHV